MNWIRDCLPCTVFASALASDVLPVPGTSSSSRWPCETRQVSASRTTWVLPTTACSTLPTSLLNVWANQAACSGVVVLTGVSFGSCCYQVMWLDS